ncbi:acyltransferase 3 [Pseudodesulfovibrio mercurii]|uniref:Acyltransferase 3 n=2 Tax=Pseudodesulfovibrio mercurii TaxID=641491 RepID=F0JBL7_9BACT|nr:acyltransferase 3 [Pseudodesulfovibrio mercurii]
MTVGLKKRGFLIDMHYFRAFAILNVALVHTWKQPVGVPAAAWPYSFKVLREVLFHDSTIYFIFISGFLFDYLAYRFDVKKYYKNKILNVICPYVIISTLIYLYKVWMNGGLKFSYLQTMLYGRAEIQYWYIPFISLVFAVSPLLLKIKKQHFIPLVAIGMVFPLLGTRTTIDVSIGQYVYFFPVYCFGAACSRSYDEFVTVCEKYFKYFSGLAILLSGLLVFLVYYNVHGRYFLLNTESIYYLQKMMILFCAVKVLQMLKQRDIYVFNLLANYSFAIYFLHTVVFRCCGSVLMTVFPDPDQLYWPVVGTLLTLAALALTILLSVGCKKVLGRYSRMIIGA